MKPSPFPGMDPYLEKYWGDVHHSLIQYSRDALAPDLPGDLRARVEERVFLETPGERTRQILPDAHVSQAPDFDPPAGWNPQRDRDGGAPAVAEPLVFNSVEVTEGYIEIRDRSGAKVVTVIEFVSPSNRLGGVGREKYLEKQRDVLASETNLVEIDLVRKGAAVVALPHGDIPEVENNAYVATIALGWDTGYREVYPIALRERLPILPIPLRRGEERLPLDLQALLDRVYEAGRYDDIDYGEECGLDFPGDDSDWVRERSR